MDAKVLMLALAGAAGFSAAFILTQVIQQIAMRARARRMSFGSDDVSATTLSAQLLRNGVPALKGIAQMFMRIAVVKNFVEGLAQWASGVGVKTSTNSIATLLVAGYATVGVLASFVAFTPVAGIAACALITVILEVRMQAWRQAQHDIVCEGVPDALSTMGECFQSGYSLEQTMDMVAHQTKGELGVAFENCADILRLGGTTKEALGRLRKVEDASELSFIAVALDIQHQSGGSIAAILAATQEVVQDKVELRRSLQVQTAQARLSAQVVCIMPFALVAILSLVSEGFLTPFFSSVAGTAMLVVAILMEIAGVLVVRRMLKAAQ